MTATVEVLRAEGIGSVRGPRHLRTDVSLMIEAGRAGSCWAQRRGEEPLLSLLGAFARPLVRPGSTALTTRAG